MKLHHKKALVLNADYSPVSIIGWQRAMILTLGHYQDPSRGAQVVDFYDKDEIRGVHNKRYPIPAVIRTVKYIHRKRRNISFSRKNVFIRDKLTCQYCGFFDGTTEKLTYDHVIPRSTNKKQGNNHSTNWANIVTCCMSCNRYKADRTPEQAGMTLKRRPTSPNPHQYILGLTPWTSVPKEWEMYLTSIYKKIFTISENNGVE